MAAGFGFFGTGTGWLDIIMATIPGNMLVITINATCTTRTPRGPTPNRLTHMERLL